MSLSCTVSKIKRHIGRKSPIVTYSTFCSWHPLFGVPSSNFAEIFGIRKLESLGVRRCLRDPIFIPFSHNTGVWWTDRWTDRQTHDNSIYRTSIASRGKNRKNTISYILPVLWMTSCFHIMGIIRDDAYVSSSSPGGATSQTSDVVTLCLIEIAGCRHSAPGPKSAVYSLKCKISLLRDTWTYTAQRSAATTSVYIYILHLRNDDNNAAA